MFNEAKDLGYITRLSTDSLGRFKGEFNQPQKGVKAIQEGEEGFMPQYMSKAEDTLYFFTKSLNTVYLERYDSTFSKALYEKDTLDLLEFQEQHLKGVRKPVTIKPDFSRNIVANERVSFKSSVPISEIKTNLDFFLRDTLPIADVELRLANEFELELMAKTGAPERYKGVILPESVTSEYAEPNDSTRFSFSVLEERELGEVSLTIELTVKNPLIILMDAKGEQVESFLLNDSKFLSMRNLKPNKYTIYCIEDLDRNGQFTTGNYELGIQPEVVFRFPQTVEARANWSQDFTWKNQ